MPTNVVMPQMGESVAEGILEWNKAFERIGFNNAIEVKQQPADAKFDTLDAICAYLECQPGDILEYLPDETTEHTPVEYRRAG